MYLETTIYAATISKHTCNTMRLLYRMETLKR